MKQAKKLLRSYLNVTQHMSRQFRNYFSQQDLTFPQALVLTVLSEEGPMPISRLADRAGSANSTVSGIVDRLEKMHLVERLRSEEDRRVIYVALTEGFRTIQKKTEPSVSSSMSRLLKQLSTKELTEICDALDKLDAALIRAENDE